MFTMGMGPSLSVWKFVCTGRRRLFPARCHPAPILGASVLGAKPRKDARTTETRPLYGGHDASRASAKRWSPPKADTAMQLPGDCSGNSSSNSEANPLMWFYRWGGGFSSMRVSEGRAKRTGPGHTKHNNGYRKVCLIITYLSVKDMILTTRQRQSRAASPRVQVNSLSRFVCVDCFSGGLHTSTKQKKKRVTDECGSYAALIFQTR